MSTTTTTVSNDGNGVAPNTSVTNPATALGEDGFLKLLVAQLQYQDPMSPTDNQQFIQEQATFSTVESLNNLQTTMTAMQASDQFAQGVALIGKNVTYVDSQGNIGSGAVSAVSNASGTVELNVGGAAVDASSVVQVDDGTEAAGA
ncbi:MAG TPA: flagellar hook capping FlgD N-terminal domain-containing protein [Solirubrobacteraceae bacterium]|jgi:flagellar basal-body rod modification protein FlgD|nr:flagellar hook capping FlgD N-terminal domain-containing protein [Solirubrobacteraceae bacterium]